MYSERLPLYQSLETLRNSKVLVYITGDRPGLGTQIHPEVLSFFSDHLDTITNKRRIPKISLFLYTSGGFTMAAWSIVNLLKQFCNEYEVIIPSKAHSAGTIIALGADKIILTKQATLSPIDPSINGPLNPVPANPNYINQNGISPVPVSVEAISGFFNFIKYDLGITKKSELNKILLNLGDKIHPLVIGDSYRAKKQIHQIATNLLKNKIKNNKQRKNAIKFLTEDSGSHDYTICRDEVISKLGLPVEKPNDELYDVIKQIYNNISEELELCNPFNPISLFNIPAENVPYSLRQALIESNGSGSHVFLREGIFHKIIAPNQLGIQQELFNEQVIFEGWRHELS
jgi:hypothetical protein